MSGNLEELEAQQWTQVQKRPILIPIPKKGSSKECVNHRTVALISHASKVILKILHTRLQHYVNQEFPDVQAGFSKRSNCQHSLDYRKSKGISEKQLSVSLTTLKPMTVWITANCRKLLERRENQTIVAVLLETCTWSRCNS